MKVCFCCSDLILIYMEKKDIIIFALVLAFVGLRLYMKYSKGGMNKPGKSKESSTSVTSSKDDDYEPYKK